MNAMNRLTRFLAPRPAKPARIPIVDRNEAVAALVERCGRITPDEALGLAGFWATAEQDPIVAAAIAEGWRLARQAGPDVDEAANAADWSFRWTLGIPSDGALYADTDPIAGRAIRAIKARAAAVVAGDAIPVDLARALGGPWQEAIDTA